MPPERSAYDPVFGDERAEASAEVAEGEAAKAAFERASRAYLASPFPWLVWAAILPAAALATPFAARLAREAGILLLWSGAILAGGAVEGVALLAARRRRSLGGPLGAWAMRVQGNLSLVAIALSAALVWVEAAELLPGLWLLLLGHSFFALGGLALPALRVAGIAYQIGGAVALLPGVPGLLVFAAATAAGNLWVAWGIVRRRGQRAAAGSATS
jgi:hypothetical protein